MQIPSNQFLFYEKEVAEKHQKIYSFRESPNSPAVFGFKRTGRIN